MAATTDRARFYLEQSIPELRELERKNIFSKAEISNIIKKRSDFEHKLNARGARSTDFARYAEFEINLDALRKKRTKRLGIKAGQGTGRKRIFQVLDRATKKFHGDLGLWMQYLSVCRRQKSYNKMNEVLSNVIRMHPTKAEVWTYAACYSMEEQGDMVEARSYMQRGLRFCKNSREMWLTYARLELLYITKVHARQKILGLSDGAKDKAVVAEEYDLDADMIALPRLTADDLNGNKGDTEEDDRSQQKLAMTPALSGAIPMAIFDAATKQLKDIEFGGRFFDMALDFTTLPCFSTILEHIVQGLMSEYENEPIALACYIRQPTIGLALSSREYPNALATAFSRLRTVVATHPSQDLVQRLVSWLVDILHENPQEDVEQALLSILLRVLSLQQIQSESVVSLLEKAPTPNPNVLSICFEVWPEDTLLKDFATDKLGREAASLVQA